eukprot:1423799-Pyramimonas_sp.AAC.1
MKLVDVPRAPGAKKQTEVNQAKTKAQTFLEEASKIKKTSEVEVTEEMVNAARRKRHRRLGGPDLGDAPAVLAPALAAAAPAAAASAVEH